MPASSPVPPPTVTARKLPSQARSRQTVACIVEAAARVLATGGLTALNTNRVAEVAGVSVGSLYQYFPNKAALLAALIERQAEQLASAIEQVVSEVETFELPTALSALLDVAIAQQFGQPLLAAALDHEEGRLQASKSSQPGEPSQAQQRLVGAVARLLVRQGVPPADCGALAIDALLIAKALIDHEGRQATECPADLKPRLMRALLGLVVPLVEANRQLPAYC